MKLIASVALLAVTALGHATDLIALTDQEFDAQFVCPEAMTNNEDRQAAVHATIVWAQAQHKDWTETSSLLIGLRCWSGTSAKLHYNICARAPGSR